MHGLLSLVVFQNERISFPDKTCKSAQGLCDTLNLDTNVGNASPTLGEKGVFHAHEKVCTVFRQSPPWVSHVLTQGAIIALPIAPVFQETFVY